MGRGIRSGSVQMGVCIIVVFLAGCGMEIAESTWRTEPITIDGVDDGTEWEHAKYLFEEQQVTVGLVNDTDRLYVYLSTGNEVIQRQVLTGGLTIWIDPAGGDEKRLGIGYPTQGQSERTTMMDGMERERPEQRRAGQTDRTDLAVQLGRLSQFAELSGFDTVDRTLVSSEELAAMGIAVAMGSAPGVLVYELSLPLNRDINTPLGLGIGDSAFSLCLETEALAIPQGAGTGGRGGGMPGGMGGGPGGMGGGAPGGGMSRMTELTEPIERWITVELATEE